MGAHRRIARARFIVILVASCPRSLVMLTRKALALRPGAVRCLSHARRPLPVDPRVAEAEIQAEQVADAAWAKVLIPHKANGVPLCP